MAKISAPEFLAYCHTIEGQEISTLTHGKKFTLAVAGESLDFTPVSSKSKKPLRESRASIESFLEKFQLLSLHDKAGVFRDRNYRESWKASYMLSVTDRYLKAHAA